MKLFCSRFLNSLVITVFLCGVVVAGEISTEYVSADKLVEEMKTEFAMTVGDYFQVDYDELADVLQTGISVEQVAVPFFIAQHSKSTPVAVASLYVNGTSWQDLYTMNGLSSNQLYLTIEPERGPKVLQRLSKIAKTRWNDKLILNDPEIKTLVNLRVLIASFPSQYKNIWTDRSVGDSFAMIHSHARMNHLGEMKQLQLAKDDD